MIEPGTIHNEVFAHEDMLPTLLAAAGEPDVVDELAAGKQVGDATYKVHLDGYNLLPFLKGEAAEAPRKEFLYWTDGGQLAALRYDQWKLNFLEQRAHGFDVWEEPFVELRLPKLFTLRGDPFERADDEGIGYATLADRPRLHAGAGPGLRLELAAELRAVPAADEGGELRHRRGHGQAHRGQRSN